MADLLQSSYGIRILAIDPGNEQSAFCLVLNGVPIRSGKVRNEELISDLRAGVFEPATLAVEMIASYGMAVGRELSIRCCGSGDSSRCGTRTAGNTG